MATDYASKLFGPRTPMVVNNQNNSRLEQTPRRKGFPMSVTDFIAKYGNPVKVVINRRTSRNGDPIRGYEFGMDIIPDQKELYPTQALLEAGFTMQDFHDVLASKDANYVITSHEGSQDVYLSVPTSKEDTEADPSLLAF